MASACTCCMRTHTGVLLLMTVLPSLLTAACLAPGPAGGPPQRLGHGWGRSIRGRPSGSCSHSQGTWWVGAGVQRDADGNTCHRQHAPFAGFCAVMVSHYTAPLPALYPSTHLTSGTAGPCAGMYLALLPVTFFWPICCSQPARGSIPRGE